MRQQCMDAVKVSKYFAALKEVLSSSELLDKPDRLWNMDETGLQLDVKPTKVVVKKGSKHLHSRTSGNRETITVIACVSAAGKTLPPHDFVVFVLVLVMKNPTFLFSFLFRFYFLVLVLVFSDVLKFNSSQKHAF